MYPQQPQDVPNQPASAYPPPPTPWSPPIQPSAPPASPSGYPPPAGFPAPARPRRPALFWVLVGLIPVLAIAGSVIAAVSLNSINDLRGQVSALESERDTQGRRTQEAQTKQRTDFQNAALDQKLQRVKDLDKAADGAFRQWKAGSAKFGVLNNAMNDCNDSVAEYNRAAGPFPDSMFGSLPRRINLDNPETDCGRAFTNTI